MVRERRNSYAPPVVVLASSRKKKEEKSRPARGINYPGSDYRVVRRRLRGCAIIEWPCCISDNNSAPSSPFPFSSRLPFFFLLCARLDRCRCALHRAVLGRKPLSHLITDAVVNNGDDAQEIPRSPAIYRLPRYRTHCGCGRSLDIRRGIPAHTEGITFPWNIPIDKNIFPLNVLKLTHSVLS